MSAPKLSILRTNSNTRTPSGAHMGNFKETILRAMPQMLFLAGYAAVLLSAVHLYVSLMWDARQ